MRTTIAIDDGLLRSAKRRARQLGITLGELVEKGLRREIAFGGFEGDDPPIPVFDGKLGSQPGVDLTSNRSLYELLDEAEPPTKRR